MKLMKQNLGEKQLCKPAYKLCSCIVWFGVYVNGSNTNYARTNYEITRSLSSKI